ncbi:kinetochore protein Nuf2-like isoform X2 [Ostrea edulis]|uniref:kinetochore protein Nuf2-like isoform X2 n=1 Tax=Ostrea edulis TaxID=37623 RepID=UPI002095F762|nr:kinetochore protein Nuf2-like isoform X2 [Ostrea edulis]
MDQTYSFPLLTVDQIVQDLNFLADMHLEEKDFKQPSSQRWLKIYCRLVEMISGVSLESIIQQTLYVTDEMEYPELYEEAIEIVVLSLTLKRMLSSCGIADFSVKDVKEPSPNRVLKIMCAVANMIKFQSGRIQLYQDLKEENDQFRDQFDHMIKKRDATKARIQELKENKLNNELEFTKVQEQLEILNGKMQEQLKKQAVKQKAANEVKVRRAEKVAIKDKIKLAISQCEEEGQKLSQKIVQSPEKVKVEQEMMKQHLLELRGSLEKKRQQLEAKGQQVEEFKVSIANSERATKLIHTIKVDMDLTEAKANEITAYREKTMDKKDSLRDFKKKIEIVEENIANKQEKLYKLSLQQQNKTKGMQRTLEQVQEERSIMIQQFGEREKVLQELEEQRQHCLTVLQEKQRAHAEKVNGIMGIYSEMVGTVDKHHTKIGQGWNKVREAFNE